MKSGPAIAGVLLMTATLFSGQVYSQAAKWPTKPVRIVNPTQPGGPSDVLARSVAQKFSEVFGQSFVVDNRPGANGIIGVEVAARAAADGYTLLASTNGQLVANAALFPKLPFDPVRDFAPITIAVSSPFALVIHPSVPARSVADLVALAKAKPGMAYSSFGPGSIAQFGMELVMLRTGMRLTHVPYKGGGPSAAALLAGEVQASYDSVLNELQYIRGNRVRALAVASASRLEVLPDVPTMTEAGVSGVEVGGWYALLAPAGTPNAILTRVYDETVRVFKTSPELRERFESTGSRIVLNTPAEFSTQMTREIADFKKVANAAKITLSQ